MAQEHRCYIYINLPVCFNPIYVVIKNEENIEFSSFLHLFAIFSVFNVSTYAYHTKKMASCTILENDPHYQRRHSSEKSHTLSKIKNFYSSLPLPIPLRLLQQGNLRRASALPFLQGKGKRIKGNALQPLQRTPAFMQLC